MTASTRLFVFASLAAVALQGCSEGPTTPAVASEAPKQHDVGVVTLKPGPRPVVRELPGRIAPTRIAEVRARVSGIVIQRTFEQGSEVKAGHVLYRLDPAPYEVELRAAEAALAKAKALAEQETRNSQRMETLAQTKAVSQSQLDLAVANRRQADADVQAREADVARANLNLAHTVIRAPIDGRLGRALISEGALVGQNEATHMATILQLGTVYADFTQSVSELNQLRRDFDSGDLETVTAEAAKVRLVLDDGAHYRQSGRLLFSDSTVDPTTGQVTLRGEFPNPLQELLPGMYVRVEITQGIDPDAISVPQQAVRRNDSGASEVFVVRDDNRAVVQPVRLGRVVDGHWLLLDGVKSGDRVIVDGFQKFVAGDKVNPSPWQRRSAETAPPAAVKSARVARDVTAN